MLPRFVPSIDPEQRERILAALSAIETEREVRILFAVESGSRAWGFPSADSDYDVRFVYVHPLDWYLSLNPGRDVIELPIEDELDIGGWDIRKALTLLLKPNPVMLEWLSSPIRYVWRTPVADRLVKFSEMTAHASACLHHYHHLGDGQWERYVGDRAEISYKKYFYVLRPALAIRWVRSSDSPPPMNLQAMVAGLDLDETEVAEVARLLDLKKKGEEAAVGPRVPVLDALIRNEFDWAKSNVVRERQPELRVEANNLFREIVRNLV